MPLSKLKLMALEIAGLEQKKGLPLSKSISDVVREEEQLFFSFFFEREGYKYNDQVPWDNKGHHRRYIMPLPCPF